MNTKVLLFMMVMLNLSFTVKGLTIGEFCVEDSLLSKTKCWNATKMWVMTTMDSYNARIVYEDESNGVMMIEGKCKDSNNSMRSVKKSFVIPYLEYDIEITMRDGYYSAKYTKVKYSFESGYGESTYGLSEWEISRMRNELDLIVELMYSIGETWEIDGSFKKEGEAISKKIEEANQKKEDKSLSRKERRNFREFYEENVGKDVVYSNVYYGSLRLIMDTFYNTKVGLDYMIEKTK